MPTFSIKIKSPKFILESTENISGSVRVDYVYGKPVNGTVVFKFGTKAKNGRVNYFGSTGLKQLVNGSAQYFIETNQFRQMPFTWFPAVNGFRFVVEVSVHERATGKKDRALDESGLFVTTPYVISFKNTFSDFKPNVETYITVSFEFFFIFQFKHFFNLGLKVMKYFSNFYFFESKKFRFTEPKNACALNSKSQIFKSGLELNRH